jgi:aspartyl-tRNA(Asn)/glutamyl-tRNA(Gln) amidotransferase subunit A
MANKNEQILGNATEEDASASPLSGAPRPPQTRSDLLDQLVRELRSAHRVSAIEPAIQFRTRQPREGDLSSNRLQAGEDGSQTSSMSYLAEALGKGATAATTCVGEAIADGRQAQSDYGAFLCLSEPSAMEAAAEADDRWSRGQTLSPLDGVPIAVKDIVDIAGCLTTAGSRIPDTAASEDAECIRQLKRAGVIVIGKTALHEWAYGVTSDNPYFGTVRNPVDPQRIPGGSSGGSAVAVALGVVPAALGSDTGGSIRIPAGACGVVGYKPTYDLISRHGCAPQAWSLDHIGPLTRRVVDAWLLTEAAANGAQGAFDWIIEACGRMTASLQGRRLGVLAGWEDYVSDTVGDRHALRLQALRDAGAELETFSLPGAEMAKAAWLTIILAESAAFHACNLRHRRGDISDDVLYFLEAGECITAQDYLRAQQIRRAWSDEVSKAMAGLDAVVCPTLPDVAPPIGVASVALRCGETPLRDAYVYYQWPANFLGAPSISVPGHLPHGQLPVGMTLTGRAGLDHELLRLARSVELCLEQEA